mmetsp:Transcript_12537/g.22733  ORF Transcript_12537/g.22733 Transcript_12537/m.22733 type:complete len:1346 (-) Transcript_12537:420-4457(-)
MGGPNRNRSVGKMNGRRGPGPNKGSGRPARGRGKRGGRGASRFGERYNRFTDVVKKDEPESDDHRKKEVQPKKPTKAEQPARVIKQLLIPETITLSDDIMAVLQVVCLEAKDEETKTNGGPKKGKKKEAKANRKKIDHKMLAYLTVECGYSRHISEQALLESRGGISAALDWLAVNGKVQDVVTESTNSSSVVEDAAVISKIGFDKEDVLKVLVEATPSGEHDAIRLVLKGMYEDVYDDECFVKATVEEELVVLQSIFGVKQFNFSASDNKLVIELETIVGRLLGNLIVFFNAAYPTFPPHMYCDFSGVEGLDVSRQIRRELLQQLREKSLLNVGQLILFDILSWMKEWVEEKLPKPKPQSSAKKEKTLAHSKKKKTERVEKSNTFAQSRTLSRIEKERERIEQERKLREERAAQLREILRKEAATASQPAAVQQEPSKKPPKAKPVQRAESTTKTRKPTMSLRQIIASKKPTEQGNLQVDDDSKEAFKASPLLQEVMADIERESVLATPRIYHPKTTTCVRDMVHELPISKNAQETSKVLQAEQKKRETKPQYKKMLAKRNNLPSMIMKDEILGLISNYQVVVISGETGCGKTTQIPQIVLDDYVTRGSGAQINMICTQPRRISAMGVADRVSSERLERLGETVGYSIKGESRQSQKTRLLFCTTGVLLRRLQHDPDLIGESEAGTSLPISHIFVDEIHERDLNTDFLLIVLRDLLTRNKSIRVVLMSATLNASLFAEYFGGAPVAEIPGRAFPVTLVHLETVIDTVQYQLPSGSEYALQQSGKKKKNNNKTPDVSEVTCKENLADIRTLRQWYPHVKHSSTVETLKNMAHSKINFDLMYSLIKKLCTDPDSDPGAILVFLPGLMEIMTLYNQLIGDQALFGDASKFIIIPLHSSLSTSNQRMVFERPPEGCRKIVLSTNIAETSITIDDVTIVVDAGKVKENRYDSEKKMSTLTEMWISQASAKQRAGRAGRVKSGTCYRMFTSRAAIADFDEYTMPQMLTQSLESIALQIKLLNLGKIADFLSKAVNPPSTSAVDHALLVLGDLQALRCTRQEEEEENLTCLGYHLASLPVDPCLGKLLLLGAIFRTLDPILTIAAALSCSTSLFVAPFDKRDQSDAAKKRMAEGEPSDHLLALTVYEKWLEARKERKEREFMTKNFISYTAIRSIQDSRRQFLKHLTSIGFPKDSNENSSNLGLVKCLLVAALTPNFSVVTPKGICSRQDSVEIHPSSVNHESKEIGKIRFVTYLEKVKTSKVYIRDSTFVRNSFPYLLFGKDLQYESYRSQLVLDNWIRFQVADPFTSLLIMKLRAQIQHLLYLKAENPAMQDAQTDAIINAVAEVVRHC